MAKRFELPVIAAIVVAGIITQPVRAQDVEKMTFFITSGGPGNGANLGGLEGADAHCAKLAKAAGSTKTNWRAYLSLQTKIQRVPGKRPILTPGINARDRIGSGPWHNAKGELIAANIDELHSGKANITKQSALDESGKLVNGRGDRPNKHDILTGSDTQGYHSTAAADTTCGGWKKGGDEGSAIVGHHDRGGLADDWSSKSWNSSHGSVGCSQAKLASSGGAGLLYCFHAN